MRVKITGISDQDSFVTGFDGKSADENTPMKTVVGLVGTFEQSGNSIPGYTSGNFKSDDGEFNYFFYAVLIKEIPDES